MEVLTAVLTVAFLAVIYLCPIVGALGLILAILGMFGAGRR